MSNNKETINQRTMWTVCNVIKLSFNHTTDIEPEQEPEGQTLWFYRF